MSGLLSSPSDSSSDQKEREIGGERERRYARMIGKKLRKRKICLTSSRGIITFSAAVAATKVAWSWDLPPTIYRRHTVHRNGDRGKRILLKTSGGTDKDKSTLVQQKRVPFPLSLSPLDYLSYDPRHFSSRQAIADRKDTQREN